MNAQELIKKLKIMLGIVFVIVASPFVVQYGWNTIITTIIPVDKITVWQALGLDAFLSLICFAPSSEKDLKKKTMKMP